MSWDTLALILIAVGAGGLAALFVVVFTTGKPQARAYIVGEHGPEIVMFPADTVIQRDPYPDSITMGQYEAELEEPGHIPGEYTERTKP